MNRFWAAAGILLWALLGALKAAAEPQTSIAVFDGGTPAVVSGSGDNGMTADQAVTVEFWLSADKPLAAKPMTALTLSGGGASFSLEVTPARNAIVFTSSDPATKPESIALDLTSGGFVHLCLIIDGINTTVYADGALLSSVKNVSFSPSSSDTAAALSLGGPGFAGKIGSARVWSVGVSPAIALALRNAPDTFDPPKGLDIFDFVIGQADGGALVRPAVPALGLWHAIGAATTIPVPRDVPGIPVTEHGLFQSDETFYSIFASDKPFAAYGIASSRSPDDLSYLRLSGHGLGIYDMLDEQGQSTNRLALFAPSGKMLTIKNATTGLAEPWSFKVLEVPVEGNQTQAYGEAWQVNDKPKNFDHSIMGCYGSPGMNLFDLQEHGCARSFFREPPAQSFRFETGRNNLTIPWGWKYLNISETRSQSYSSLTTSTSEIGGSTNQETGYGFTLGAWGYSHNKTVDSEHEDIANKEKLRAYHTFVARRHSVVVDAKKMMLDQCFLRDVARLAFALTGKAPAMPAYFDPDDTSGGECDAPLDVALPLKDFADRYADSYAYAVTYGARAMQRVDMSTNDVAAWTQDGTKVGSGIDYSVSGTLSAGPVGMNWKLGANYQNEDAAANWAKTGNGSKLEFEDLICVGGSSCSANGVDVGDNPVPIYLDLRPISDLLGPPYFADPAVTVVARRAVAAEYATRAPPPAADLPLMRMFDVSVKSVTCGSVILSNTNQLKTQLDFRLGPFSPGGRFATVAAPVPAIGSDITTLADAQTSYQRACTQAAPAAGRIEFVVETGPEQQLVTWLPAITGEDRSPLLSDMAGTPAHTRIMVPMFDAAFGGGNDSRPRLYPRARNAGSPDAGKDACDAPCAFSFRDPGITHDVVVTANPNDPQAKDDSHDDYAIYTAFESIDLAAVPKGGQTMGVVLGRGLSNVKGIAAPALAYWIILTIELNEVDYAAALGYK